MGDIDSKRALKSGSVFCLIALKLVEDRIADSVVIIHTPAPLEDLIARREAQGRLLPQPNPI